MRSRLRLTAQPRKACGKLRRYCWKGIWRIGTLPFWGWTDDHLPSNFEHPRERSADQYCGGERKPCVLLKLNQRIIAENAQFTGIAAGQGVGFTTGLLHLRKGLGMRETPIRPHSWHCRMQSDYQYDGNRKRPPVWRRHRGSLRPRGRNLGRVEGMTGSCGSGCDPAIHARRLRVYHRPRRLRMASRISIFFAARRFEPLNSMG